VEQVERCEVCGGSDFALLYGQPHKYLFYGEQVWRCECGLVFLSPRLDEKGLAQFYGSKFLKHRIYQRLDGERQRLAQEHFEALSPLISGKILEIGCGEGWLVKLLRDAGRDAEGTEVCPEKRVKADVPVIECGGIPEGEWDAVLAIHLLEHLREPRRFLRDLHAVTQQIYVEIPAYDLANPHAEYHHSAHLFDFSRKHLRQLMAEEDWRITEELYYERHPKWFGVLAEA